MSNSRCRIIVRDVRLYTQPVHAHSHIAVQHIHIRLQMKRKKNVIYIFVLDSRMKSESELVIHIQRAHVCVTIIQ